MDGDLLVRGDETSETDAGRAKLKALITDDLLSSSSILQLKSVCEYHKEQVTLISGSRKNVETVDALSRLVVIFPLLTSAMSSVSLLRNALADPQ